MIFGCFLVCFDWVDGFECVLVVVFGFVLLFLLFCLGAVKGVVLGLCFVGVMFVGSWYVFYCVYFLFDLIYLMFVVVVVYLIEIVFIYYCEECCCSYIYWVFDCYFLFELVNCIVVDLW